MSGGDRPGAGLAQRYYLQAFSLARQTRSPTDEAYVLRIMAHHGMDNNSSEHVLGLAERAMRMTAGKVSPGTEALFVICRARPLADCELCVPFGGGGQGGDAEVLGTAVPSACGGVVGFGGGVAARPGVDLRGMAVDRG